VKRLFTIRRKLSDQFVKQSSLGKKLVAYFLSFSLLFSQTAWAINDIVPPQNTNDNPINHIVIDPDRAGNTTLDRAQNETPVVNINPASAGGVSANYYRDFNVNEENLILNNYQGEAAVSKLGGALHGNPNLNVAGTRAADIILNEVTSSRVTNLNGYTEIFGKQAELIIANPNGIMVGGAGYINTSRLARLFWTLTFCWRTRVWLRKQYARTISPRYSSNLFNWRKAINRLIGRLWIFPNSMTKCRNCWATIMTRPNGWRRIMSAPGSI
jgi:filamentous hemagglutinin family protein